MRVSSLEKNSIMPGSLYCFMTVTLMTSLSSCNKEKPDIFLIFTDQQTMKTMSIAGNEYLSTPNMDRLAKRGIRFENAYCTSPVSGPSRATIITGLMPSETGVNYNGDSLLPHVRTVGEIFREAGYKTVWAGKWHLPESYPQRAASNPKNRKARGFELLPFWDPDKPHWMLGAETDPPLTDAVNDFLRKYDRKQPLFLAISYHNPHDICFHPRKEGWVTKDDSLLNIRYYGFEYRLPDPVGINPEELNNLPPLPDNFRVDPNEPQFLTDKRLNHNSYGVETKFAWTYTDKEWQSYLNAYYRLTEMVDREIGRLIEAIDNNGYGKNSIIVFTSDHGDGAAAHKWAAKLSLYNESANVPFIFVYPTHVMHGKTDKRSLVSLADIVPTFCDYAGIVTDIKFAGKSLRPVLERRTSEFREYLITELADYLPDPTRTGRMVRSASYKYNYFSSGSKNEQFFDLVNDPGETVNQAYNPAYKALVEKHQKHLSDWNMERREVLTK